MVFAWAGALLEAGLLGGALLGEGEVEHPTNSTIIAKQTTSRHISLFNTIPPYLYLAQFIHTFVFFKGVLRDYEKINII
jgi:hypothetical protein